MSLLLLSSLSSSLLLLFSSLTNFFVTTCSLNVSSLSFKEAYTPLFGDGNLVPSSDGKSVSLVLNRYSGSGFISSSSYDYGFFSASIKLPSDYTAGIVVAFYTSNAGVFEKNHDELDFEFLGNVKGKEWRVQTNVYGNGSVSRGREERYLLWFDPSKHFHRYSILWTQNNIVFYIDHVPIREVVRTTAMGGDYPSKPMSLYATIWDGSTWATSGGKYKVDYKYEPFVSEFKDLVLQGCSEDPIQQAPSPLCHHSVADYASLTSELHLSMHHFRHNYLTYSYCYDTLRYSLPPPECVVDPLEKLRFKDSGHLKLSKHRSYRRPRRRSPTRPLTSSSAQMSM